MNYIIWCPHQVGRPGPWARVLRALWVKMSLTRIDRIAFSFCPRWNLHYNVYLYRLWAHFVRNLLYDWYKIRKFKRTRLQFIKQCNGNCNRGICILPQEVFFSKIHDYFLLCLFYFFPADYNQVISYKVLI